MVQGNESSGDRTSHDTRWIDRLLEDANDRLAEPHGVERETTDQLPVARLAERADPPVRVRWSDEVPAGTAAARAEVPSVTVPQSRSSSAAAGGTDLPAHPAGLRTEPWPTPRSVAPAVSRNPGSSPLAEDFEWTDEHQVAPARTPISAPVDAARTATVPGVESFGSTQRPTAQDFATAAAPAVPAGVPRSERGAGSEFAAALREWGLVLGFAVVVAFLVRMFLIQAYHIPSGSMQDTLQIGDRVIVNRLSYSFGDIQRGEIVVFEKPPGEVNDNDADHLIKRVIGLPGETILFRDGDVFVDGARMVEPYLSEGLQTRPTVNIPGCANPGATASGCVVPDGTVFVMGDNRGASQDSRRFGPVAIDSIQGRAFVRVWPIPSISWL